ncbi:hypothetical protein Cgig2_013886 [Carnegiea gigantea]|uniref:Reverse transcriptase domain-containing protein n=1 Tax=Carnegiea gigantea TaxID=171969 RepID=A0A9Q1GJK4_9CARY|nr:hypothetical protein Cgig2_013886 [Carnegiea gigantea]
MADTITRQVSERETSLQPEGMSSLRPMKSSREVAQSDRSDRLPTGWQGGLAAMEPVGRSREGQLQGHPMLHRPPPMTAPPRPQNARKYCEFHEQSGHTTTECRELKKALNELADRGQINQFLKRAHDSFDKSRHLLCPRRRMIVATIAGGYVEEIAQSAWKVQLRSAQQEVNPTGMIHLPVRFGDKSKFKSLKVDFLDRGPPQRPAHACPQSAGRPQNTSRLQIRLQGFARPCRGIRGRRSSLAGSPAPWLGPHQPRPSPADAAALSSRSRGPLGPPAAYHSVSDIERRAPLAVGTLRRPSPPGQRPQPWSSPLRTPLVGLKPEGPPSPRI